MLNKIYKAVPFLILLVMPLVSLAQSTQLKKTGDFFFNALNIVQDILIPLAFTLALLFFFWGVAKYIWSAGGDKEEGKKIMIWGVVALFVMTTIWGLIAFIADEFGVDDTVQAAIPKITY